MISNLKRKRTLRFELVIVLVSLYYRKIIISRDKRLGEYKRETPEFDNEKFKTKKMKSLQKISTIFHAKSRKRKAIPEERDGSKPSKVFHSPTKLIKSGLPIQNGEDSTVKNRKMKGLKISTIPHPRKRKGIAAKSLNELKQKIPQKFSEEVCKY